MIFHPFTSISYLLSNYLIIWICNISLYIICMFTRGAEFANRGDSERVEERLRSKCSATLRTFPSLSGWKKQDFVCQNSFKINFFINEVVSFDDLYKDNRPCVRDNQRLEEEVKTLYEEMQEEIKTHQTREEKLLDKNKCWEWYVRKRERYSDLTKKSRKTFPKWVQPLNGAI